MLNRRLFRLLSAGLLAFLPTIALAHAILEDSSPAAGSTVQQGPADVRLRFNSRIDKARSRLTLIRTDRSQDTLAIQTDGPPDILAAHLDVKPGAYVLRWQVLAVDGHITRGDVPFSAAEH